MFITTIVEVELFVRAPPEGLGDAGSWFEGVVSVFGVCRVFLFFLWTVVEVVVRWLPLQAWMTYSF